MSRLLLPLFHRRRDRFVASGTAASSMIQMQGVDIIIMTEPVMVVVCHGAVSSRATDRLGGRGGKTDESLRAKIEKLMQMLHTYVKY